MSSRWLSFSLCLNLVLLGAAGYWTGKKYSGDSTPSATEPISKTNHLTESNSNFPSVSPALLHWSELESEDYPTYVAKLRRAGCPEPVLRLIIGGEVREMYAQKAFALVQEFHRDFWEIATRENVREHFEKTLGPQVKTLCNEPDALLKRLLGDAPRKLHGAPTNSAHESRFSNFLSSAKQEQLRQLAERYEALLQAVRHANLSPEEKTSELANVRREMENEQAQILSPEELTEYQLRQSSAATELQQLHGVDFSETELRNLAKTIDDYHRHTKSQAENDPDADSETLEQKLETVLSPERFADFNRARSASYRELCEVASDFGQPINTAAEIFDLRLASEKQSDEIRADKNRTLEQRQALLDALQEQVDQDVLTKFGAEAYQSYKARDGRWINSLGRL